MTDATLDGRTCRAARALLNWSSRRLSIQAGVPVACIFNLERGRSIDRFWIERITATFAEHGIEPIETDGRLVGVRDIVEQFPDRLDEDGRPYSSTM